MISFIYARSSLLAATGKRACIITANKLSPIELSHLIWTHLHMIVFVYVRSGWRKKNKKTEALTGKSLELLNFAAVPLRPPFLPALHEKSNAFSPFPLAETQRGGVILSRTQLSDVNRHLSLICSVCEYMSVCVCGGFLMDY